MNSKELKELLESLQTTDIEELRFKSGDKKIYFKKGDLPSAQVLNRKEEKAKGTKTIAEILTHLSIPLKLHSSLYIAKLYQINSNKSIMTMNLKNVFHYSLFTNDYLLKQLICA